MIPVIAVENHLVGSGDGLNAVGVSESLRNVLSESVACAPRGDAPTSSFVRIRPQEIAHGALQRREKGLERKSDMYRQIEDGDFPQKWSGYFPHNIVIHYI